MVHRLLPRNRRLALAHHDLRQPLDVVRDQLLEASGPDSREAAPFHVAHDRIRAVQAGEAHLIAADVDVLVWSHLTGSAEWGQAKDADDIVLV